MVGILYLFKTNVQLHQSIHESDHFVLDTSSNTISIMKLVHKRRPSILICSENSERIILFSCKFHMNTEYTITVER
uniref:Uncharacterized protein n=1 Tax=Arundo donax TaxID=35708 RepID=A0A0A8ZBS4_ARUDO